ncbi:HEAT repeat domain-containing protein [Treponema pedis]|uniref:HEAT repeat domain-containing protein n=1 Tax=Treponema pedis TaxID=409322 RepID=UPI00197D9442|nr:HEAT repeat domain-containing protein [Treponema pedis]
MNIQTEINKILEDIIKEKREFVPYKQILRISELLLNSNDDDMLEYHFSLLKLNIDATLYHHLFEDFEKRPFSIIEPFLLKKIHDAQDIFLRGEAIRLLGSIGSNKILPYEKEHIKSKDKNIRERCIIVLGRMGDKDDLPLLNDRLQNDTDNELRGDAATAMRSLWMD